MPLNRFRMTFWTVLFDCLAVSASFLAAYNIRFVWKFVPVGHVPDLGTYAKTLAVILPVYLVFFRALGLYDPHRRIRRVEEIFLVLKAVTYAVVILMALTFFYRGLSYSRLYLVTLWVISFIAVAISRYLLIQWEYHRRSKHKDISRVLLVGANRNARHIIQWARHNPHYGQEIVGVLSRETSLVGKHFEGVPVLGVVDQSKNFIDHLKPDQVVMVETNYPRENISEIVALCEDRMAEFKIGADFYGLMTRHVDVEYMSSVPLLGFRPLPLDDFWDRLVKRLFDLVVSLVLLLSTLPFWGLLMALIRLNDHGPIFYEQERLGRDGKIFKLLKFRTMKVDAEKETGPVWAKPDDGRRTRMGNFLRRWNLDELPQLWNVIRGNMSLVGPRPERPHFVEQFRESIPRYMARHQIKSGLTGWAQVNGLRGDTSIEERLKYDLYYMENWSLLFDIEILFMTLFAFKNAY